MSNLYFILRSIVYLLMFLVTWFAMDAINYEKLLRKNKVNQAQVLYFILVMAIAYLAGSFILSFFHFG
jgi:putative membrane protein